MEKLDITNKIKEFVLDVVHIDKEKIQNDTPLFKQGYFDSMGFMVIIGNLEEEFHIKILDEDLIEENFDTIDIMTSFVSKKLS